MLGMRNTETMLTRVIDGNSYKVERSKDNVIKILMNGSVLAEDYNLEKNDLSNLDYLLDFYAERA